MKKVLWPQVKTFFQENGFDIGNLSDKAASQLMKLVNNEGLEFAFLQISEVGEDSEPWELQVYSCKLPGKRTTSCGPALDGAALFGGSYSEGDRN